MNGQRCTSNGHAHLEGNLCEIFWALCITLTLSHVQLYVVWANNTILEVGFVKHCPCWGKKRLQCRLKDINQALQGQERKCEGTKGSVNFWPKKLYVREVMGNNPCWFVLTFMGQMSLILSMFHTSSYLTCSSTNDDNFTCILIRLLHVEHCLYVSFSSYDDVHYSHDLQLVDFVTKRKLCIYNKIIN
jgi:hypothetical protein